MFDRYLFMCLPEKKTNRSQITITNHKSQISNRNLDCTRDIRTNSQKRQPDKITQRDVLFKEFSIIALKLSFRCKSESC